MNGEIKGRATIRRIINAGYTPIRWRAENRVWHGWLYKEGTRYYHCTLIGRGKTRIPKEDRRYISVLAKTPGHWEETEIGKKMWVSHHEQLP